MSWREWRLHLKNAVRALLGMGHSDISDHIAHPNRGRHFWNCEQCGREFIPWDIASCPKCWMPRPPIVAPPDAPMPGSDEP